MKLSDRLALCRPENPYKWPLEFFHLSCQKRSKGFHHQSPRWSLCIRTKPTEKRIWQSEQSCPQTTPPGFKCEIHRAENVRRGTSRDRLLAGPSGNPALCEVKGRGHLVCALQRADGSGLLSNVSQDCLAMLQREHGAYILAVQLFMYLPWFLTGFHHIPKPPTYPSKPDGTRRSNRKRRKLLRVSWVMNSPYALQNSACEKTAEVTLWEIFLINHVRSLAGFASFKMLKYALWHLVLAPGAFHS